MANGEWGGLRTVVSEKEVSDTVDAECANFPRLSEAWEALEWLLARNADKVGTQARHREDLRLYVQADDILANVPAIWVIYRVGEQIDIVAVKIVAPALDEDDD